MSGPAFLAAGASDRAAEGAISAPAAQLVLAASSMRELTDHLFPGDGEEHGAVLQASWLETPRGVRLLVRDVVLAREGVDFVPGRRGHRRLTPDFVNRQVGICREQGLVYLAVHNHGPGDRVRFSSVDLASHERGYPALLDISGHPVGALVLSGRALAGDIWTPDGGRHPVGETVVLGHPVRRLYPSPAARPAAAGQIDDRAARIYGAAGQQLLGCLKVGIIGTGGVGMMLTELLARLGIGHLVLVDGDRVELSNLPRLPGSRRWDARWPLSAERSPAPLRRLAERLAAPKVRLARRLARRARPGITVDALRMSVNDRRAAEALQDCDFLLLAADSHSARAMFNALATGFLIPGLQVGSKVTMGPGGEVGDIFSVVRAVDADSGCLKCNELISPARLREETTPEAVLEAQRYLPADDAPAPSVGTLNAVGAAQAANHLMLQITGLLDGDDVHRAYRMVHVRDGRVSYADPRRDPDCRDCSTHARSRRARADLERLPIVGTSS